MSLLISSLNSGSNGNCYYIGSDHEAVLIDAGISCRETEKRMQRSGLNMSKVKAVFISHEHSDHISGVETISKKYSLPVYITKQTFSNSRLNIDASLLVHFESHQSVKIGNLNINTFPKNHDAIDPHSFTVEGNGVTIGVFTDIGSPCENVHMHFKQCHAAFLEANYDEELLENGSYPVYLKNRIRGSKGHLSNHQALQIAQEHRSKNLSHLFLAHLSKENNSPALAQELFFKNSNGIQVVVASRYSESKVYRIFPTKKRQGSSPLKEAKTEQLCLF